MAGVEQAEVVVGDGNIRVIGSRHLLVDLEGALIRGLGLLPPSHFFVDEREVVERDGYEKDKKKFFLSVHFLFFFF